MTDFLEKKWAVGQSDRGNDHFSYAVLTEDSEMVVKTPSLEVAEHLVEIRNVWFMFVGKGFGK